MKTFALPRRPLLLRALLPGGFGLVLALGAAASSPAAAVAGTHAAARARAAASGGTWGQAEEVPGLAALNVGADARVTSVSCARPGNCGAGGFYADGAGHGQGFVVNERAGAWGQAEEVPGLAALNAGGNAGITSVSCTQPGACGAGGNYLDGSGNGQGFVVDEKAGVWGQAQEVPGLAALNATGHAEVTSVSCAAPGECSAVGQYQDSGFAVQGFVVTETNGVWGQAEAVPGLAALNTGAKAGVTSVSCGRPGDCSAGGNYMVGFSQEQGFVVTEKGGVWGQAEEVPGLAALNRRGLASVRSVSCAGAGDCGAGGFYEGGARLTGFVVSETNGHWGRAEEVPGLAALRTGRFAGVRSLSCARPGDCGAGGFYEQISFAEQGFVVSETNGHWGRAEEVPGLAALNTHGGGVVSSVSCTAPGECSAGGFYIDGSGFHGFVVTET